MSECERERACKVFDYVKKLRIADRLKLGHVTLHKTHLPAGGRVARGPDGWCGERACGVCGFVGRGGFVGPIGRVLLVLS